MQQRVEQIPVNVVGSSVFGIYPKISIERTWNMYITDGWLVSTPGYEYRATFENAGVGRGLFYSARTNTLIAVNGSSVFTLGSSLGTNFIGNLETSTGEVRIDENLSGQICIVDGVNAYIYSAATGLNKQVLKDSGGSVIDISPSYVEYHNTYFLITGGPGDDNPSRWYIFSAQTGGSPDEQIVLAATLALQTKPDVAVAVHRLPGRGNNVAVFGRTVTEIWTNVATGDANQPYRRVQSYNIDVGCFNTTTIAASTDFVVWLGSNEKKKVGLYVTDGSRTDAISTDGIDHLLENLNRPDKSTALMYKQDGHLFYQITFYDESDNMSLIYDFNTKMFFDITDEKVNYHPARQIVLYDNGLYFVSLNDNNLYEMSSSYLTYKYTDDDDDNGYDIPRNRIPATIRKANSERFRVRQFIFTLEQGVCTFSSQGGEPFSCVGLLITEDGNPIITETGAYILGEEGYCPADGNAGRPIVQLGLSKNGNQSFNTFETRHLNEDGRYRNMINWHRMGEANELSLQLRFFGFQRFVANNGVLEVY